MQNTKRNPLSAIVDFLSSFLLASTIFILLLLLTYLGTIEQVEVGLFQTQKKYFESLVVVHRFFNVLPVPLPGGYLLMFLLSINLLFGGIVRMRKGWRQLGVLITHLGIVILMVGSLITFEVSIDGHMSLLENERSNVFESYHEWELAVTQIHPDGKATEYIVPGRDFVKQAARGPVTIHSPELPFSVIVSDFMPNANPRMTGPMMPPAPGELRIDNVVLEPRALDPQQERNVAGAKVTLQDAAGDLDESFLLWGMQEFPASTTIGDSQWALDLRHKRWEVPFTIVLDKFTRELHPGTGMAAAFESDVTKIENGAEQKINISMNKPLRHQGYTFFQSSWRQLPDGRLQSTFSVVRNPADKFPLYACIVITFGMALHFLQKLTRYLRAESKRTA